MSSRAPKGLTVPAIVAAALAELRASGLDGLSLRAVARRLGVEAPALSWHVGDKRGLLHAMGTELWRPAIEAAVRVAAETDGDWRELVVTYARTLRASLTSCRDAARVVSITRLVDRDLIGAMEAPLQRWAADGHEVSALVTLVQTAQHATIGFCLSEEAWSPPDLQERRDRLADLPGVADIGHEVLGPPDERFEAMLDLLIGRVSDGTSTLGERL